MKLIVLFIIILTVSKGVTAEDYQTYVKSSKDFRSVSKIENIDQFWPEWVMMPWRTQWGRKFDGTLVQKMAEWGYTGAFQDHMPDKELSRDLDKSNLRWYLDHTAGKGYLYLKPEVFNKTKKTDRRPVDLHDSKIIEIVKNKIKSAIENSKKFNSRLAYALDDEISWSSFTSPVKWDNNPSTLNDYSSWLKERYRTEENLRNQWGKLADQFTNTGKFGQPGYIKRMANPDDFQNLYRVNLNEWNLSPWIDAVTYMDSHYNNLVGDLVEYCHILDPATPAGYVGGQAPAPFGGFDYVKLTKKIQFLEAYDIGSSMEIVRSFNRDNHIATVKTGFGQPNSSQIIWENWHYLVHGDRGLIYWAPKWFTDSVPEKAIMAYGKEVQELTKKRQLYRNASWVHDGIALYYSHASIQTSWFIDSQTHGKTWINRSSSMNNKLASTIGTNWAWQKILEDLKLQYNWIGYDEVIQSGIPMEYKVLILPRTLALSEAESTAIKDFVKRGGTVIADHLPGIFDHHGKSSKNGGQLDGLFGINQSKITPSDLFSGEILAEWNADKNYKRNFLEAGEAEWPKCKKTSNGQIIVNRKSKTFNKNGSAYFLNVSIVNYLKTRDNYDKAQEYLKPLKNIFESAGAVPRVSVFIDGKPAPNVEVTYWKKDRNIIFSVMGNPLRLSDEFGGKAFYGKEPAANTVTLVLDRHAANAIDQSNGKKLGEGKEFTIDWQQPRAAILSVDFEQ